MRLAVLLTHPVQYYSPWFADLSRVLEVKVFYALRQTPQGQAEAGFGVAFDWDLPLLDGYAHTFLRNVARRPRLAGFAGCDTPDIGRELAEGGFDALLTFGWNKKCYVQGLLAARRLGIPAFIRVDSQLGSRRAWWWRGAKRLMYRLTLPRFGNFIVPGRRSRAYLRHYGVAESRIFDVPHMIDVERFASAAARARASGEVAALRAGLEIAPDAYVFLFVAKFIAKKRPLFLLSAFRSVAADLEKAAGAPVTLVMAGDGPLRTQCEDQAAGDDLDVRFPGFVNQSGLPALYASCDCIVLPSDSDETWGLVVNEAFACRVPAVVSIEAGAAADIVDTDRTGWVFDPAEPGGLERAMIRAVEARGDSAALAATDRRLSYRAGTDRLMAALSAVTGR